MKRLALSLVLGVVLGLAGWRLAAPFVPSSPTVAGLRVGGEPVPADVGLRRWLSLRAEALAARPMVLRHGEERFVTSYGELGVGIDLDRTVAAARAVGHTGSPWRRVREAARARSGRIAVPLALRLDEARARQRLAALAEPLRRAPVDARLDLDAHRNIPDVPGRELDVEATLDALRADFGAGGILDVATRAVRASVTVEDLEHIDVSKVLAHHETRFVPSTRGRGLNVVLAGRLLDGLVIAPGATVSFNDRVGPRTLERGFQLAPEIVGDELTTGVGGGSCQVSSTLFAASVHGGLEVVERRNHSRASDYVLLGLDATVKYGAVDLKIRNPYAFPIVVHSFTPKPGTLRVELLGGDAVESVQYRYAVTHVEEFVRRITVKEQLDASAKPQRRQRGTRGMDVHSSVLIRYRDGRLEQRTYFSGYKPTPEVFWVPVGYDEAELPPLPLHAKGVEGRLGDEAPTRRM